MLKAADVIGKKTMIYGEAGSGKTKLLADLITELTSLTDPAEITIIDLAPERVGEFGGPITQYISLDSRIRYLRPGFVYAPRLMACNPDDLLRYVNHNYLEGLKCFDVYALKPTKVLAVNDVTVFLHKASVEELMRYVKLAETFLATAYYGEKLSEDMGTGISRAEKEAVERLMTAFEIVVRLNSSH